MPGGTILMPLKRGPTMKVCKQEGEGSGGSASGGGCRQRQRQRRQRPVAAGVAALGAQTTPRRTGQQHLHLLIDAHRRFFGHIEQQDGAAPLCQFPRGLGIKFDGVWCWWHSPNSLLGCNTVQTRGAQLLLPST